MPFWDANHVELVNNALGELEEEATNIHDLGLASKPYIFENGNKYKFEFKTFIVIKDFDRMKDDYVRSGEDHARKYMKPYPIYKVIKRNKNGRVKKVTRRLRMRVHRRTSP